jgi:hypothetical protein
MKITRSSQKREAFKEKIEEYLKIEQKNSERLQVWFWDETGFSLRVIRRKNWCLKGKRKKVRGDRPQGKLNVMEALRYSDKKKICRFSRVAATVRIFIT